MILTRRRFLAAGLSLATTDLSRRAVWAAQAKEPRALVHCLSNETYSLRALYGQKKLDHHTVAAFHKDLNIRGVSLNDLYFQSWDKEYLDRILETFKANERKITCLIMEGNLSTPKEDARKKQIESNTAKLKAAGYLGVPVVRMNLGGVGKDEDNL